MGYFNRENDNDKRYPMKKIITSLTCCSLLLACGGEKPTPQTYTQQIQSLSSQYFSMRPEIASYFGVSEENAGEGVLSTLSDWSPEGEQARRKGYAELIKAIDALDKSTFSDTQLVSLNSIRTEMVNAYKPAEVVKYGSVLGEYGIWFLPYAVSHLSGPHVEFSAIMEDKFAVNNAEDAQAFLNRLAAYEGMIEGTIAKIKHDQNMGVIPPDFVIENTINNLSKQLSYDSNKHPLINSLTAKMAAANVANSDTIAKQAVQLMDEHFYPATSQLKQVLNELLPLASHHAGIDRLPDGDKLYQSLITHFTDTNYTAEQIHAIGLEQVARIDKEMDALLKKVGYEKGSVGERMKILLNDPQYIYPNTDEGKAQLIADIKVDLARVNKKLPQWFGMLPDQDVDVKAVPAHQAAASSGAFYDAPSQDGKRKGTFWIALHDTASLPSYSLQTLTYHETNPGHHLQTILGLSDDLPLFSTIFYSNAAGEGWGLYSERLGAEMGLYENDPVDDLGRLQAEMHRAVRLVVDTGMHALGWSREKAIEYSMATEGNHVLEATSEVERYVVWPGQALGYKIGELKILELRERAKQQLGDKFDIKVFHDRILEQGALPLNIMEQKIDNWLATQH